MKDNFGAKSQQNYFDNMQCNFLDYNPSQYIDIKVKTALNALFFSGISLISTVSGACGVSNNLWFPIWAGSMLISSGCIFTFAGTHGYEKISKKIKFNKINSLESTK